jgi:hypothetical protein
MPLAVCRDVLAVGTVPVSQGVGRLRPSYASLMGLGEVLCALAARVVLLGLALAGHEGGRPADVVAEASWPDAVPPGCGAGRLTK